MFEPTPTQLLAALRAGDTAALGHLLEHYRPYLTLLAQMQIGRVLRVKADAEDLVQEAFLVAVDGVAEFRGSTGEVFLDWLQTVLASRVSNFVRWYCRTEARDVGRERALAADWTDARNDLHRALAAPGDSPSRQAASREYAVLVAAEIGRLSDDHRQVIRLRVVEGLAVEQVAERMGRSKGAVSSLLVRALRDLRDRLGRERP